jgi:hypothetical protein
MTKEQIQMLADKAYRSRNESDAFVAGWEYSQRSMKQTNNNNMKTAAYVATIASIFLTTILLILLIS